MKRYMTVFTSLENLDKDVNILIGVGWEPLGGPSMVIKSFAGGRDTLALQALTKLQKHD